MTPSADVPIRTLFGVPINAVTLDETTAKVEQTIRERSSLLIGVVNVAKLVNMRRDPLLRESVLASDIILADGMGVVLAARLLGRRLPERVAGIDLMHAMLAQASIHGHRVFLLGATEEVSSKVAGRFSTDYPGAIIVGRRDGYFSAAEEPDVAAEISRSRADILLVAMSPPKKEKFLGRWFGTMGVPVCHGVGGAFDVTAGKVRRAPEIWQRWGLEWLYRVFQEPRRMWRRYLVTNTIFAGMLLREMIFRSDRRCSATRCDDGLRRHGRGALAGKPFDR